MLLAVVLCFSALPFSVSADEVSSALPSESSLESQPEEPPAEETEESPPPAENGVTLLDTGNQRFYTPSTPSPRSRMRWRVVLII